MRKTLAAALLTLGLGCLAAPAPAQTTCGAIPALPDSERRTEYTISASTGPLAVGFQLYGDSTDFAQWVQVWVNGVQRIFNDPSFGWTLTSPSGPLASLCRPITDAQITFTAPQTGTIEIVGARRARRASQVSENRGVTAHDFNQIITDLTAENRETWDMRARLFLAAPGQAGGVITGVTGVFGPGSSTDKGIARFFGTTGGVIQNSSATISDAGTLILAPTAATTSQGIAGTQTTQNSATPVAGPLSLNLLNLTQSVRVTGAGSDNTGNNNAGSVGFRVNTFYSGANLAGASTLLSGLFSATVQSTAALADVVGLAGTAYTNVVMSHTGFLEGMNAIVTVGPTGTANIIVGMDAGAGIQTGGVATHRWGMDVGSSGNTRGTTSDIGIAFIGVGGSNPAWGTAIGFTSAAGAAPINGTTSIFGTAGFSYTVLNFADLGNMTVTDHILNFPNVHLRGNASLALGTSNNPGANSIIATGAIAASGLLGSGGAGVGNGVLSLGGNTSGGWNLTSNALGTLATATGSLATSGSITDSNNGIGIVSTDGFVLQNTTAAAAGAQQYSPRLHFIGQGWKTNATAASQTVDWIVENQPSQGAAAPSAFLAFLSQINAGGYTVQASLSSGGALNVAGSVQTGTTTVGALPTCNAGAKGQRYFVTDSNAATFHTTVAAGGANNVGVTCDGTNWYISANDNMPEARKFA